MNHSCRYRQLQIEVLGNLRKQQFSGISSSIPVPPKVHSDREIACIKNCCWVRDFEDRKQYNKKNTCIAYNSSYKYVSKRIKINSVIYEPNHTFGHIPTLENIKWLSSLEISLNGAVLLKTHGVCLGDSKSYQTSSLNLEFLLMEFSPSEAKEILEGFRFASKPLTVSEMMLLLLLHPLHAQLYISIAAVEIFFHVLTRAALWSSLTIFTAPFVQEIIQNGQGSCTGKKYFIVVAEFPLSDTVIHQATAFRKVCACHPQVGGLLELTFSCYSFLRKLQYISGLERMISFLQIVLSPYAWWKLLEDVVHCKERNGKLGKPEVFPEAAVHNDLLTV
ncbi:hypothetical protein C5167_009158 [Papaver somniferum]|uniref:Uncharacterized protein n=1 Tax=Papaver somniferum TaxID=3469 RepID=A0A4Y7JXP2_PAPSO|nr:hypothetical protein C5167_009158 [Papaver somniferum]